MNLKDLKSFGLSYDWKTLYVGIEEKYFNEKNVMEYAIELMEDGEDNDFINELAWGVSREDLDKVVFEIKANYFPELEMNDELLEIESRKLRFVCLSQLKDSIKNGDELLNEIAVFYEDHNYPSDMVGLINYMPQDPPTTKDDLLNRFNDFLQNEQANLK